MVPLLLDELPVCAGSSGEASVRVFVSIWRDCRSRHWPCRVLPFDSRPTTLLPGMPNDGVRLNGNHPAQAEAFTSHGRCAATLPRDADSVRASQPGELDQLLADQQNPASAHYHQWLKTGEFFRRFGPSNSEVKALEAWLRSEGFTITTRARTTLGSRATSRQAQHAFDVRIAALRRREFVLRQHLRSGCPATICGVIGAILGMDNMVRAVPVTRQPPPSANRSLDGGTRRSAELSSSLPRSSILRRTSAARQSAALSSTAPKLLVRATSAPSTTKRSAPGQDGTGDCIAIVGISDFLDSAMTCFHHPIWLAGHQLYARDAWRQSRHQQRW